MKGFGVIKTNEVGWLQKERPTPGPLDAILRPVAVAPCTSDVHAAHGGSGEKSNLILGHEAIGEVVEVGSLVKHFKKGDIAIVSTTTPNWLSESVQGNHHQHDESLMGSFKFLKSKDGVFAEFFHVNQADANMYPMPDDVSYEQALMIVDMMSTGFYGAELANIHYGDTVVVIGIGPVGLMSVAGAKLRGAGRILAVGTRPNCVRVAKEYGANDIISYKEGDIVDQILSLTNGNIDSVIIAGGTQDTFAQAVNMVRPGGTVSNVNFFDVKDQLAMPAYFWGLGMSNKDIRGGFCPGGALRIKKLLQLIQNKRIDTSKIVSHRFEGFDKMEDAYLLMESKTKDLIKPIVRIKW